MKQKKLITSILFSIVSVGILYAQETTVSTGGLATGTGGTSSFSIGQAFYTTNTGAGGTMSQGVQQVYDISTSLGEEITTIKLELSVFPNPVSGELTVTIGNNSYANAQISIYSVSGNLLYKSENITNFSEQVVDVTHLPIGLHYLELKSGKEIHITKFIKTE